MRQELIVTSKSDIEKNARPKLARAIVDRETPDDLRVRPIFNSIFGRGGNESLESAYEDLVASLIHKVKVDVKIDIKVTDDIKKEDVREKMEEMIKKARSRER